MLPLSAEQAREVIDLTWNLPSWPSADVDSDIEEVEEPEQVAEKSGDPIVDLRRSFVVR